MVADGSGVVMLVPADGSVDGVLAGTVPVLPGVALAAVAGVEAAEASELSHPAAKMPTRTTTPTTLPPSRRLRTSDHPVAHLRSVPSSPPALSPHRAAR